MRALLEYEQGDFDAGATYIARLQELTETVPPPGPIADHVFLAALVPLVGRTANNDEGLDAAGTAAEQVLSLPRLAPVLTMLANCGLALIAVQRGDASRAEELYDGLESQKGTASFFIPLTIDRLLGLLAATFGRVDAALAHFEAGLAFCDRAGYRPEHAWTACDYSATLLARRAAGDRDKAVALQDAALVAARELEMRPLIERILARREILT
jgi:hypothetical protein